jgi:hypothetical protein
MSKETNRVEAIALLRRTRARLVAQSPHGIADLVRQPRWHKMAKSCGHPACDAIQLLTLTLRELAHEQAKQ